MSIASPIGYEHKVVVGIADLAVTNNPNTVLTTYSLGSCLGVAIFDPVVRVGGLLHLMLPDSSIDAIRADTHPAMFVDTGVSALFRAAADLRGDTRRFLVYVAGGAELMDNAAFINIGRQNYEALVRFLDRHQLRIHAEDIGGLNNRTVSLNLRTGGVSLRVSGQTKEVPLC